MVDREKITANCIAQATRSQWAEYTVRAKSYARTGGASSYPFLWIFCREGRCNPWQAVDRIGG